MLMLGREVILPNQIVFPFPKPENQPDPDSYIAELRAKLEEVYHLARENLKLSVSRQKRL